MTYQVDIAKGNHVTIGDKLKDLLNNATIATLHSSGIVKVGTDFFLCWIAYE